MGNWLDLARNMYRFAFGEVLERRSDHGEERPVRVAILIEELEEACLDLKQAVIDEDPGEAMESMIEVQEILADLRRYGRKDDEP